MRKPVRDLLILLVLIAASASAYLLWPQAYPSRPDFTLPDIDGTPHRISQYDGKVLVLNFWATWCIPCREEIPMLIEAQSDLGDRGLQIIGIAVDKRAAAADFARRYGINYPVLANPRAAARVQDDYVQASEAGAAAAVLPYSVIIDRRGGIRAHITGQMHRQQLDKRVQPLLREDA